MQVKKISTATVYGKINLVSLVKHHEKNGADTPLMLMRVYGQAVGEKTGTSAYGDWNALVGRFKAVNLETGEEMEASQCFLPEIALIPLRVQLAQPETKSVTFAIDVGVRLIPENKQRAGGSPYEYLFENVVAPSDDDPLLKLEAEMNKNKPLALPGKEPAPPAAPAAAPAAPAAAPAAGKGKRKG